MATAWSNWAGERCVPAVYEEPSSVEEVVAAVRRAAAAGQTVRVAGAGHSFSSAVLTGGTMLSLRRMARVLDVDPVRGLVRVQAGITLGALSAVLWEHGLAFENLGDIDVQTIAGATATGTHGTGERLRNLSAGLVAVQLVDAAGEVHELTADDADGGETWRAARVSVGALGVVTAVTLRAVPAFVLSGADRVEPREEVFDAFDERSAAHDHFECWAFAYAKDVITRNNDRVDGPPRPRGTVGAWLEDVALKNGALAALSMAGRARPQLIPALNRTATRFGAGPVLIDRSYRIFATPRLVHFNEMEYAIPRAHLVPAARVLFAAIFVMAAPGHFGSEAMATVSAERARLTCPLMNNTGTRSAARSPRLPPETRSGASENSLAKAPKSAPARAFSATICARLINAASF